MADTGSRRALGAALLASSLLPLNSTMIAVALPDIAREFARPPGTVAQAVVASYLVAAIVLQSPGGKLGDRLGHWRILALGEVLMVIGAVLGMVAWALGVLAVARVLMAAGGAATVPATVALLRIEVPPSRRGRAFGMFGAVMSLAAGVGPVVGGELVRVLGWPSIFAVNLPVIGLAALLAAGRRRPAESHGHPRFDLVGAVLLTATLIALVLGMEVRGVTAALLLGACGFLLALFAWWERRVADPVVAFALFRSLPFTAGSLLVALQNLVMYTAVVRTAAGARRAARRRLRSHRTAPRRDDGRDGPRLPGGRTAQRPDRGATARGRRDHVLPRCGGPSGNGRSVFARVAGPAARTARSRRRTGDARSAERVAHRRSA